MGYDQEMVPKTKYWVERLNPDSKLPNFNIGRILVLESQAVNESLESTKILNTPESSKDSETESLTLLPPLKNLQGASPSSEVMSLTFEPHSPKERPGFGIMKHTKPETQDSSNKSVSGTITVSETKQITPSVPTENTDTSKSLRPKPIQKPQFKCELCHYTNHLTDDCYRILYCMICKREDHRTLDHEICIASLKRSENYKAQPYQYASSSKQILKAKAKPFPPCRHCGFNDHRHDDCRNYPECGICVKCNTCGSTVHSTTDHNEFDHFKREIHQGAHLVPGQWMLKEYNWCQELSAQICRATRYTWVHFLRKKSQAPEIIMSFIVMVANQNDVKVKQIRTDNGTEFINHELERFCDAKGISQNFSSPYTPDQNGVAERKNRTLIEAARTMLNESDRWLRDQHIKLVNIIGDPGEGMLTRSMVAKLTATSTSEYLFADFLSEIEPKTISEALKHLGWVDVMQEEMNQFNRNKVWTLVSHCPYGKIAIGSKWVFRNKKIDLNTIKNKARLVAQGYSQEERIDYDETFAPLAMTKSNRIFLCFLPDIT
ncbi:retrovirus-related pol polyprotein from transposon TNT 1-94 [Tanacetum coccineum]